MERLPSSFCADTDAQMKNSHTTTSLKESGIATIGSRAYAVQLGVKVFSIKLSVIQMSRIALGIRCMTISIDSLARYGIWIWHWLYVRCLGS